MRTEMKWRKHLLLVLLGIFAAVQPAVAQIDESANLNFPMEDELIERARETVKAYET